MTNKGLRIEVNLIQDDKLTAILECHYDNDFSGLIGVPLVQAVGVPSVYMRGRGDITLHPPSQGQLETIYIAKENPVPWLRQKTCRLDSESMSNYGFHVTEVAPKRFPWNSKGQTLKILIDHDNPLNSKTTFKFGNSHWDFEPVVLFVWKSIGDKAFVKILASQGKGTLQHCLDKEGEKTQFDSRHSIPLPPPRNSKDQNATLTMNASVKKEIVFRREIFVLKLWISADGV